jgi:hypothetical protein
MNIRTFVAATAAVSLAVAPAVAAERINAPASDEAEVGGGSSIIVAILAAAAVIGGIIIASDGGDDDLPASI